MLRNDLDLVLHLGDYTYEYAIGPTTNRAEPTPEGFGEETVDLRTYRLRHTLYKLDPDLQAAHEKFPFSVIWDDHEVQNDYSGIAPEWSSPSPEFSARRVAAYQAWYEHMPVRSDVRRLPRELRIYRRLKYGRLAEFTLLDGRQYRSDNPCGDGEQLRCQAALDGDYTFLGREQAEWAAPRFRAFVGAVERRRSGSPDGGARPPAVPGEPLLERRVGRLPARRARGCSRPSSARGSRIPCSSRAIGTRRS